MSIPRLPRAQADAIQIILTSKQREKELLAFEISRAEQSMPGTEYLRSPLAFALAVARMDGLRSECLSLEQALSLPTQEEAEARQAQVTEDEILLAACRVAARGEVQGAFAVFNVNQAARRLQSTVVPCPTVSLVTLRTLVAKGKLYELTSQESVALSSSAVLFRVL